MLKSGALVSGCEQVGQACWWASLMGSWASASQSTHSFAFWEANTWVAQCGFIEKYQTAIDNVCAEEFKPMLWEREGQIIQKTEFPERLSYSVCQYSITNLQVPALPSHDWTAWREIQKVLIQPFLGFARYYACLRNVYPGWKNLTQNIFVVFSLCSTEYLFHWRYLLICCLVW